MRTNFGDYRAKMAADEKSAKLDMNKVKIGEVKVNPNDKVTFIKKAAVKTAAKITTDKSDSGFKFDFDAPRQ